MQKKLERKCSTVSAEVFKSGWALTIDPGIHTATALWHKGKFVNVETIHLSESEPVGIARCLDRKLPNTFSDLGIVIIEGVELFSGSAVSFTSAARGDLFQLSYIVGILIHYFMDCDVHIVSPRVWKGQLNYKMLRHILSKKFSYTARNDHEAAAVGMGLWARGEL